MRRYWECFIFVLVVLLTSGHLVFAQSETIEDLISNSKRYDGKKVIVEGEAIGHLMKRGDHAWFNINDDTSSIGIWINSSLTDNMQYLGKHAVKGDWVRVDGMFYSHCSMHGGDTDIHADSMAIVRKGNAIKLTHDPTKVNILTLLTGLMVCLYIIKILKRQR